MRVRLQGGPFDGERMTALEPGELGDMIYVVRCAFCKSHWYRAPKENSEPYERDDEDGNGWLVYVYVDPRLQAEPARRAEEELVTVGGGEQDELVWEDWA